MTQDMAKHLFEAFSTLSDAQELIARGSTATANDLINHSKLHLLKIQESDPATYREAVIGMRFEPCMLGEDV